VEKRAVWALGVLAGIALVLLVVALMQAVRRSSQLATKLSTAESRSGSLSDRVATLEGQLTQAKSEAAAQSLRADQLQAEFAARNASPIPTVVPSPAQRPLVITLTYDTLLRATMNQACQAAAGANATSDGQARFVAFFHDLERQQQAISQRGGTYYIPNPAAQAAEYARSQTGVCY